MEFFLYLAGPIKGRSYEEAIKWRDEATRQLQPAGIICLSPMRWRPELSGSERITDDYKNNPMLERKGIVTRDRFDVKRSHALLVNFLGAEKCSPGTPIEYGWANAWDKPIITVMERTGNPYDHGFIRELSGYCVETLDEGIEIARKILCPELKS